MSGTTYLSTYLILNSSNWNSTGCWRHTCLADNYSAAPSDCCLVFVTNKHTYLQIHVQTHKNNVLWYTSAPEWPVLLLATTNTAVHIYTSAALTKWYTSASSNNGLANATRPCNCSVLCLHPKSALRSCPHSIFRRDVIRQRCRDSVLMW